jgi:glutamyl-tRNA reductase
VSVVAIGLNLKTAPLELLERIAVPDADRAKALYDLRSLPNVSEAVVLSTCHRIEVYATAERFHAAVAELRDFLLARAGVSPQTAGDAVYFHHERAAAAHLFRVAAGLDSAVIGESEILGQVAGAWEAARREGASGPALNLLFRHAVEAGKRARSATGISRGITSVSQAALALAASRLGGLGGRRVLVVGAGSMGEQLGRGAAAAGPDDLVIASRTTNAAETLAERVAGRAADLRGLLDVLAVVDVCFTSTGATVPVLTEEDVAAVVDRRGGRPLLIVDIAVPRDVEPSARELPSVTLLDIDDVRAYVAANLEDRRREGDRALPLIADQLDRYEAEATAREVAPLIRAVRAHGEAVRQAELERLANRLDGLSDRQRAAVESVTRGIVAKLLHDPTMQLKDAAGTPRAERLAEALRDLFDL